MAANTNVEVGSPLTVEAIEFPRMRRLDVRVADALRLHEAANSVRAVARGIEGHCYFLLGNSGELACGPECDGFLVPGMGLANI